MTSRASKMKSAKDVKQGAEKIETTENLAAAFTLPDSLPCSEVEFPILIQRRMKASWKHILDESHKTMREIEEYEQSKKETVLPCPFLKTESEYIQKEIFVQLLPALEETLNKAKIWEAFTRPQCFFNGIDHIVQVASHTLKTLAHLVSSLIIDFSRKIKGIFVQLLPALEEIFNKAKIWEAFTRPQCFFNGIDHILQVLWNNNPRYPERQDKNLHIFNMPWVQHQLKLRPRPYYPKSWLWPKDYAATLIQKTVRQYFIQRDEEVQEMREFWRKLELERNISAMDVNPFLAKLFASQPHFSKK